MLFRSQQEPGSIKKAGRCCNKKWTVKKAEALPQQELISIKSTGAAATRNGHYKMRGAAATRNGQYKKRGAAATRNGQ